MLFMQGGFAMQHGSELEEARTQRQVCSLASAFASQDVAAAAPLPQPASAVRVLGKQLLSESFDTIDTSKTIRKLKDLALAKVLQGDMPEGAQPYDTKKLKKLRC